MTPDRDGPTPARARSARPIQAAYYVPQAVPLYQGNPFIEALPGPEREDEAPSLLSQLPPWSAEDALQPTSVRRHLVAQVAHVIQPLTMHLDLFDHFSLLLRSGYVDRNPLHPRFYPWLVDSLGALAQDMSSAPLRSEGVALGCSLIGPSGMGKTTAINAVCSLFPQVISHAEYLGQPWACLQVTWIKLECPRDASVKSLCLSFFEAIDDRTGMNYWRLYNVRNANADMLVQSMARVSAIHGLGILIIDEIQNLREASSGGDRRLLNLLVGLMNRMRVPILFIGTPRAERVLGGDFRQARRASTLGDLRWDRMHNDEEFSLLLGTLLTYQYLREPVPTREDGTGVFTALVDAIHDESQGITSLASGLVMMSQMRALARGEERLSPALVRSVARDTFRLVRPFLQELKRNHTPAASDQVDAKLDDINFEAAMARTTTARPARPAAPASPPAPRPASPRGGAKAKAASPCELVRVVEQGTAEGVDAHAALAAEGWVRPLGAEAARR